jgi:hypothetical protein
VDRSVWQVSDHVTLSSLIQQNQFIFREFAFRTTNRVIGVMPLNRRHILIWMETEHDTRIMSNHAFQLFKLDWSTGDCLHGNFIEGTYHNFLVHHDSQNNKGDLCFLLYNMEDDEESDIRSDQFNCLHCLVSAKHRRVQQLGTRFKLSWDRFASMDLRRGVVRGLSATGIINCFDLWTRKMLVSVQIKGITLIKANKKSIFRPFGPSLSSIREYSNNASCFCRLSSNSIFAGYHRLVNQLTLHSSNARRQ